MGSMLEAADRAAMIARMRAIRAEAPARWGTMTAPRMVAHLYDSTRMMLDEIPGLRTGMPVLSWPGLKPLFMLVLPIPKGRAQTAPQLLATAPGDLNEDIDRIAANLDRFARADAPVARTHPAFGTMTKSTWGRLAYRHFDHHVRQFGG